MHLAALAELGLALEDGEQRKGAALAVVIRVQHYQTVPETPHMANQPSWYQMSVLLIDIAGVRPT